ncbi:prepilin-type N-terminal cleavage/methylation domain-containing protein [Deinococcus aetherius]|uniref:Prepilin-type N-terminal cleavage/methylation domain-containing protein n=1 Tax=Deinococcus aetherius TaxID=200252 RepID=A0ABM8A904_9DEIO|nr:type II secretion system protein [Deinococcus aetherius]BDP40184.1 prepilin-type N-terminal cleavage/methylation domain-containing protein [Deinococcus aetherius]
MRPSRREGAFTLLELLVGMALVGLILTALLSLNLSTNRSASSLQVRNDLLAETQTAQNYVVGKLRDAAYVFPAGTTLVLGTSGGYSTRKPGTTSSGTWTVGTDPIIAFVLPPRATTPGTCSTSESTTTGPKFCYTFYAYYPVQRNVMTGSSGATGANNPGADATNDASAWVLMEYRRNYASITALSSSLASGISSGTGLMVLDYLRPPASGEKLFDQTDSTSVGVSSVTLQLATQRLGGQTVLVPATGRHSVTVYPRNVGKPVVPN